MAIDVYCLLWNKNLYYLAACLIIATIGISNEQGLHNPMHLMPQMPPSVFHYDSVQKAAHSSKFVAICNMGLGVSL